MRGSGAALFLTVVVFPMVALAMPAAAADMPSRKAGLWEITSNAAGRAITMQQCIDAATDHAMQSQASSFGADCAKRDVQKSTTGMTIDSVCTVGGKTTTSHIVVNGSFDSNYTMSITSEGGALPAARTVTLDAKWLGPCAADQKPGDMIMPNGMKVNVLNLPKTIRPPGAPAAAPGAR